MKLSDYCDKKTFAWTRQEHGKTMRLINYINQNIDVDLYEIADSKNSMTVFNNLKFWLFKFHNKELLDGFQQINANYDRFIHGLIYSLILGITRDNPNTYLLYDILKSYNIIDKMMVYDDETHQIFTKDYGEIHFIKADSCLS